jgi:hypothetical protein
MINEKLQDFATSVIARGQITFGDVRRLQRDCLPAGITSCEEAKTLIALNATLVRADKAWAQWVAAALANFVTAHPDSDPSIQDRAKAWLHGPLAASASSTTLGRRIARQIRRELAKCLAIESTRAPQPLYGDVRACDVEPPCETHEPEMIRPIVQSDIVVRPNRGAVMRAKRRTAHAANLSFEVWPAGIMEKHLRFQLVRPDI